jgi:hypothetical protein
MDNIGVFDRDKPLPDGGQLEQSDGTSWMALYCIIMLTISTELSKSEPFYQNMAIKYFEHYLYIAHAMTNMDGAGIDLWNSDDKFFYDVVLLPDGQTIPLRIYSMVGLVPLFAVFAASSVNSHMDEFLSRTKWFIDNRPDLLANVALPQDVGANGYHLMAILTTKRLVSVLQRMLNPSEFLSDYGIRALSRYHLDHPYELKLDGENYIVKYLPAESDSRLFGGNSNWRGPIWFPVNYMIVRALHEFSLFYGDSLQVECPTGSGSMLPLDGVAREIARRLASIFLRDPTTGRRATYGDNEYFQTDPHWRDHILFSEYFNGDTGAGLGASHQTGWTALVISLLYEYWELHGRS